jgi:hypothetical protein
MTTGSWWEHGTDQHAEIALTADDWERAVDEVRSWYPADVFTSEGRTLDGISGTVARRVCELIRVQAACFAADRVGQVGRNLRDEGASDV